MMLRFLASISPVAVLLIGALPSLAIGWGAREAKFAWLDRPAIIREATATADAACAIRAMDAANRAEQAERARQSRANAEALRIYDEALKASQRAAQAAESQFEQEIQAYEHQLDAEGRSCLLTQPDIDWLHERGTARPD
jgi:hypothetical protein